MKRARAKLAHALGRAPTLEDIGYHGSLWLRADDATDDEASRWSVKVKRLVCQRGTYVRLRDRVTFDRNDIRHSALDRRNRQLPRRVSAPAELGGDGCPDDGGGLVARARS